MKDSEKIASMQTKFRQLMEMDYLSSNGRKECPYFNKLNKMVGLDLNKILTFAVSSNEKEQ